MQNGIVSLTSSGSWLGDKDLSINSFLDEVKGVTSKGARKWEMEEKELIQGILSNQ